MVAPWTGGPTGCSCTRCWWGSPPSTARMRRNSSPPSPITTSATPRRWARRPRKSARGWANFFNVTVPIQRYFLKITAFSFDLLLQKQFKIFFLSDYHKRVFIAYSLCNVETMTPSLFGEFCDSEGVSTSLEWCALRLYLLITKLLKLLCHTF